MLMLLATACGQRYSLGDAVQPLNEADEIEDVPTAATTGTTEAIATLVANGPEDVDVAVGVGRANWGNYILPADIPIGDVDGDGYDDWITEFRELVYGGPRVAGGTFPEAGAPITIFSGSQDPLVQDLHTPHLTPRGVGDVDGDSRDDLLFETRIGVNDGDPRWGGPAQWPTQRAYLWYGRADRPGMVSLEEEGVAFEALHAIRERFDAAERGREAMQALRLASLGDIDADGFDDFSYSYIFNADSDPSSTESVTSIYYGGTERLPARGAIDLPAAQLLDTLHAGRFGDIDGDGLRDFLAASADGGRVIPGSAQRLSGELAPTATGTPLSVMIGHVADADGSAVATGTLTGVGDLDRDGSDDFVFELMEMDGITNYLFYGDARWASTSIAVELADATFTGRARVTPLGDWNADGFADLMLQQEAVRGDELSWGNHRLEQALWQREARVLRGAAQRYAGDYTASALRPELPTRDPLQYGGPVDVWPIGDIDGDGFADVQLTLTRILPPTYYDLDFATFIKYGAPLGSVIH